MGRPRLYTKEESKQRKNAQARALRAKAGRSLVDHKLKNVGLKWGRLTALNFVTAKRVGAKGSLHVWRFRCDCGNEAEFPIYKVRKGYVGSCGCAGLRGEKEVLRDLKRTYKLSDAELKTVAERMHGVCEICGQRCGQRRVLCVDHCHDTGAFRGLLCNRCNRALGVVKDNPETLRKAASYLDAHNLKT